MAGVGVTLADLLQLSVGAAYGREQTVNSRPQDAPTRVRGEQEMKPSDRYLKIVEWSEEDGCYVGTCPGIIYGGVHGSDESEIYQELCHVVSEVLELYTADNKPLPLNTVT